ncbi:unnamed protein product [Rotaria sp. Silwood1]|nr:unnamed protein product [Rotaria sp. Silwood1]
MSNLERLNTLNETIIKPVLTLYECNVPTHPYYVLFISITSFYLPLIIMIYVYIKMYLAAKKQAFALRSGYKCQYAMQSEKSFFTNVSLRQMFSGKKSKSKERADISNKNVNEKSEMLLQTRRPPDEVLTLRIHHGKYKNPSIEEFNQNNGQYKKSVNRYQRKNEQIKNSWQRISINRKAGKFVGIIMGVFVICWLPYHVYFLLSGVWNLRLKDEENHELIFNIFSWLGYTNSALDVVIYSLTSKEITTAFRKLWCKL